MCLRVYGDLEDLSTLQADSPIKRDGHSAPSRVAHAAAHRTSGKKNIIKRRTLWRVWAHDPQVTSLVSYNSANYTAANTVNGAIRWDTSGPLP